MFYSLYQESIMTLFLDEKIMQLSLIALVTFVEKFQNTTQWRVTVWQITITSRQTGFIFLIHNCQS